jgi:ATP-dependent RNA circularization protein (DNA/RNA ligase family)
MEKYPKIQTVYKRDPDNNYKTLLMGTWALPEFEYLADNDWTWTEKIDGTNIRVDWNGEQVLFAGRTDKAQTPAFLLTRLKEIFPLDLFQTEYPDLPMTLYGEGYGAKIQKGGGNYISDGQGFILFDVMIADNWQPRESVEDIAIHLDLDLVPIVGYGPLTYAVNQVQYGFMSLVGKCKAEGLVMRPTVELQTRTGYRIITKIKHRDFPT